MVTFPSMVYFLCLVTSLLCLVLLARGYMRSRVKLLFWSSLCFVGLALNNLLLFFDTVVFPVEVDLMLYRTISTMVALGVLLYGFIWEAD
jgi:hypothetical protein